MTPNRKAPMDPNDRPRQTMPFTQFLQQQRKGLLHEEITDALADIVAAVMSTGKDGSLTITLKVKPFGEDGITIQDKWTPKIPTPPAKPSVFFADEHGTFSRNRLNQPELPGVRAVIERNQDGQEAASS